ncbi:uncharacterized protein LOC129940368 [Eupeodes corollae]|uniref:uncharacterized protein LOC129940368 n=1 Tax=Eupeodes corollae TaxID=290404 RepID=UPI00248F6256|nr:uncharacterized protein LOC129940368 [Eupeodes corollae]
MSPFMGEQRAFCVRAFYENNRSYVTVRRLFRVKFGLRNITECPSTNVIKKWIVTFEATGSKQKLRPTGRPRSMRTAKTIERVQASVREDPRSSTRKRAAALGFGRSFINERLKVFNDGSVQCHQKNLTNLHNARSKKARHRRLERAHESVEQREERNAARRIHIADIRAHGSMQQHDNHLQDYLSRTRTAREQHIDSFRQRNRESQRTSRALTRESIIRLAFNYAPDINYSADPKVTIGQMYHKIGSLMPMPNEDPKFLQIYFMGSCEERVTTRCQYNFIEQAEERAIVVLLEIFLENRIHLVQLFKRVSPQLKNDNYQNVIKADKVPSGEHAGRFNATTADEVAIIMVGDPVDNRSIKITHRDNTVSKISDIHRLYDALQYPLIFWQGQDEYHINIKQCDPINAKLLSEEYIHLRDAVVGNIDGNLNTNEIGSAVILPSSYIGNPRNLQEYIQDAMTYVRYYGCPDLFITFTCNPLGGNTNFIITRSTVDTSSRHYCTSV